MSDLFLSTLLAVVLCLVAVAIIVRNWHVKDFNRKRQAKHFASYVAEIVLSKPNLNNDHGFFIQSKLKQRVINELRRQLPEAHVSGGNMDISITHKQTKWVIPVCSPTEYTKHYI